MADDGSHSTPNSQKASRFFLPETVFLARPNCSDNGRVDLIVRHGNYAHVVTCNYAVNKRPLIVLRLHTRLVGVHQSTLTKVRPRLLFDVTIDSRSSHLMHYTHQFTFVVGTK